MQGIQHVFNNPSFPFEIWHECSNCIIHKNSIFKQIKHWMCTKVRLPKKNVQVFIGPIQWNFFLLSSIYIFWLGTSMIDLIETWVYTSASILKS